MIFVSLDLLILSDLRKPENYILLSNCKAVDQTPVKLIDFGALECTREVSVSQIPKN